MDKRITEQPSGTDERGAADGGHKQREYDGARCHRKGTAGNKHTY